MALAFRLPSFRYASLHFISPHFSSPLLSSLPWRLSCRLIQTTSRGSRVARRKTTIGLTADADHEGSEVPFSVSTPHYVLMDGMAAPLPVNGSQRGIPSWQAWHESYPLIRRPLNNLPAKSSENWILHRRSLSSAHPPTGPPLPSALRHLACTVPWLKPT